jgi:predicted anti-sigma-YlaC factor YlaD
MMTLSAAQLISEPTRSSYSTLVITAAILCVNVQSQQQAVVDLLDDGWEEVRSAALSLLKALLQPTAAAGRCADLQSFVAFAEGYDKVYTILILLILRRVTACTSTCVFAVLLC